MSHRSASEQAGPADKCHLENGFQFHFRALVPLVELEGLVLVDSSLEVAESKSHALPIARLGVFAL